MQPKRAMRRRSFDRPLRVAPIDKGGGPSISIKLRHEEGEARRRKVRVFRSWHHHHPETRLAKHLSEVGVQATGYEFILAAYLEEHFLIDQEHGMFRKVGIRYLGDRRS